MPDPDNEDLALINPQLRFEVLKYSFINPSPELELNTVNSLIEAV
jgi:hypothetical protein